MLYVKHVIESIGLKVKLQMKLEMDNKGAVDLANNWGIIIIVESQLEQQQHQLLVIGSLFENIQLAPTIKREYSYVVPRIASTSTLPVDGIV